MRKILLNLGLYFRFLFLGEVVNKELFKWLTSYLAVHRMHRLYELALRKYDADLTMSMSSGGLRKRFIGRGFGANTLNAYRKIKIQGKVYFEKVYFKDSVDYRKCQFFYENVREDLKGKGIHPPELLAVEEGNKLAVVYFEFLNMKKNARQGKGDFERALQITQTLGELRLPKMYEEQRFLQDFESDAMFVERKLRLARVLGGDESAEMEIFSRNLQAIKKGRRALQHGDLFMENFNGKYVIDWDRLGFYPFGYDLGLILAFYRIGKRKQPDSKAILEEIDRLGIQEPEDVRAVYFFTVFFLIRRNKKNNHCDFRELIEPLKKDEINENTGLYA